MIIDIICFMLCIYIGIICGVQRHKRKVYEQST
jgi:hypothetical protein